MPEGINITGEGMSRREDHPSYAIRKLLREARETMPGFKDRDLSLSKVRDFMQEIVTSDNEQARQRFSKDAAENLPSMRAGEVKPERVIPIIQEVLDSVDEDFLRSQAERVLTTFESPEFSSLYTEISELLEKVEAGDEDAMREFYNIRVERPGDLEHLGNVVEEIQDLADLGALDPPEPGRLAKVGMGSLEVFGRVMSSLFNPILQASEEAVILSTMNQKWQLGEISTKEYKKQSSEHIQGSLPRLWESLTKAWVDDDFFLHPGDVLDNIDFPVSQAVDIDRVTNEIDLALQNLENGDKGERTPSGWELRRQEMGMTRNNQDVRMLRGALHMIARNEGQIDTNDLLGLAITILVPAYELKALGVAARAVGMTPRQFITKYQTQKFSKAFRKAHRQAIDEALEAEWERHILSKWEEAPQTPGKKIMRDIQESELMTPDAKARFRQNWNAVESELTTQASNIKLQFADHDFFVGRSRVGNTNRPLRESTILSDPLGNPLPFEALRWFSLQKEVRTLQRSLREAPEGQKTGIQTALNTARSELRQLDGVLAELKLEGRIRPELLGEAPPQTFRNSNEAHWFGEYRLTDEQVPHFLHNIDSLRGQREHLENMVNHWRERGDLTREVERQMNQEYARLSFQEQFFREALEAKREAERFHVMSRNGKANMMYREDGLIEAQIRRPNGELFRATIDKKEVLSKIDRKVPLDDLEWEFATQHLHLNPGTVERLQQSERLTRGRRAIPLDSEINALRKMSGGRVATAELGNQPFYKNLHDSGLIESALQENGSVLWRLTPRGQRVYDLALDVHYTSGAPISSMSVKALDEASLSIQRLTDYAWASRGPKAINERLANGPAESTFGLGFGFSPDKAGLWTTFDPTSAIHGVNLGIKKAANVSDSPNLSNFYRRLTSDEDFARQVRHEVSYSTRLHSGEDLRQVTDRLSEVQKTQIEGTGTAWTSPEIDAFTRTGEIPQSVVDRMPAKYRSADQIKRFSVGQNPPSDLAKEMLDQFLRPLNTNNALDVSFTNFLRTENILDLVDDLPTYIQGASPGGRGSLIPSEVVQKIKGKGINDFGNHLYSRLTNFQMMDGKVDMGTMREIFYRAQSQATMARDSFTKHTYDRLRGIMGDVTPGSTESGLISILTTRISDEDIAASVGARTLRRRVNRESILDDIQKKKTDLRGQLEDLETEHYLRGGMEEDVLRRKALEQIEELKEDFRMQEQYLFPGMTKQERRAARRQHREEVKEIEDFMNKSRLTDRQLRAEREYINSNIKKMDEWEDWLGRNDIPDEFFDAAMNLRAFYSEYWDVLSRAAEKMGRKVPRMQDNYLPQLANDLYLHRGSAAHSLGDRALPSHWKTNEKFNPRLMQRHTKLEWWEREMDAFQLAEHWVRYAADTIFMEPVIKQQRELARLLAREGYSKAAHWIDKWNIDVAILGRTAPGDEMMMNLPAGVGTFLNKVEKPYKAALHRTVFDLNPQWNLTTQTSSAALIPIFTSVDDIAKAIRTFYSPSNEARALKRALDKTYSTHIKTQGGTAGRQDVIDAITHSNKLYETGWDRADQYSGFLTSAIETQLTELANLAGYYKAIRLGFSKAQAFEMASDIGYISQAMYNRLDKPGILNNRIGTMFFPFQTFSLGMMDIFTNRIPYIGKATFNQRALAYTKGVSSMAAVNLLWSNSIGIAPYGISALLPIYNVWGAPIFSIFKEGHHNLGPRDLPSPAQPIAELIQGGLHYMNTGDSRRFSDTAVTYGIGYLRIPGGLSAGRAKRMNDIRVNDGEHRDRRGDTIFEIDSDRDYFMGLLRGPYGTRPGLQYLKDTNRESMMVTLARRVAREPFGIDTDYVPDSGQTDTRERRPVGEGGRERERRPRDRRPRGER